MNFDAPLLFKRLQYPKHYRKKKRLLSSDRPSCFLFVIYMANNLPSASLTYISLQTPQILVGGFTDLKQIGQIGSFPHVGVIFLQKIETTT